MDWMHQVVAVEVAVDTLAADSLEVEGNLAAAAMAAGNLGRVAGIRDNLAGRIGEDSPGVVADSWAGDTGLVRREAGLRAAEEADSPEAEDSG